MAQGTENATGSVKVNWNFENTSIFIDIWESHLEDLRGQVKKTHVFQRMAEMLKNDNIMVSGAEVKNKVNNLTRKYRIEKDRIGPFVGTAPSWEFYSRIHKILAGYKAYNIEEVVAETIDLTCITGNEGSENGNNYFSESGDESSKETPSGKRKCSADKEKSMMERMLANSKERTAAVKELVASTKEIKETLASFVANVRAKKP